MTASAIEPGRAILVLGGSFTGRYLARNFPEHRVHFLARSAEQLRAQGFSASTPAEFAASGLREYDAILDTVPAILPADVAKDSTAILDPPYRSELARLGQQPSGPSAYIHVSSTSVLPGGARDLPAGSANHSPSSIDAGDAVLALDETADPAPDGARGERRRRLEERVRALQPGAMILRAAGIYGPGRCVALQFQAGNFRRAAVGNSYVSRIHVHDLVRLFLALVERHASDPDGTPRLVHAVDERPAANSDVFAFLETELGVNVPGDWRDTAARGRIVRSRFARDLLGGQYRFPDYVTGFRDCLRRGEEC